MTLRGYSIYVSKQTIAMLRAYRAITERDSIDEIADQFLTERLQQIPEIQEYLNMEKKIRSEVEKQWRASKQQNP